MKHAVLLVNDKGEGKDIVLFLDRKEVQLLAEAAAAAVRANPRKSSFRAMLKKLEAIEAW